MKINPRKLEELDISQIAGNATQALQNSYDTILSMEKLENEKYLKLDQLAVDTKAVIEAKYELSEQKELREKYAREARANAQGRGAKLTVAALEDIADAACEEHDTRIREKEKAHDLAKAAYERTDHYLSLLGDTSEKLTRLDALWKKAADTANHLEGAATNFPRNMVQVGDVTPPSYANGIVLTADDLAGQHDGDS